MNRTKCGWGKNKKDKKCKINGRNYRKLNKVNKEGKDGFDDARRLKYFEIQLICLQYGYGSDNEDLQKTLILVVIRVCTRCVLIKNGPKI